MTAGRTAALRGGAPALRPVGFGTAAASYVWLTVNPLTDRSFSDPTLARIALCRAAGVAVEIVNEKEVAA